MSNQNQMLCVPVMGTSIFKYYCRCSWFGLVFLSLRYSFRYVWNMSQIGAIFDTFMKIGKIEKPVIPGL